MKIEQIYTGCLAQGAYYIESEGEAIVIDPLRDPSSYIAKAQEDNATIKYVLETHFHADFVSGHLDLAKKTGAKIVFGPNANPNFEFHSAKDGEEFKLGKLTIKVLHTPGHTMESTTYLLLDEEGKEYCIFTGDTLFIGDVGRPDLAVKSDVSQSDLAGYLYDSLRNKIMPLPNDVIVYPAHGAGSACGKNMSKETFDTLGNQKQLNYALRADMTKEEFIKEVTDGLKQPPQYFPKNVMMNKEGYNSFDNILDKGLTAMDPAEFEAVAVAHGALILDTRSVQDFPKGFIPQSLYIGIKGGFAPWVGTLIKDIQQPILIVADEGSEREVVERLSRVGYDNALGYLKGGYQAWVDAGKETDSIDELTPEEFTAKFNAEQKLDVLDVRKDGEYAKQHIDGVEHFPLSHIQDNTAQLNYDKTYLLHCAGGYRSLIAASIFKAGGYTPINIKGGFGKLKKLDLPLTTKICPNTGAVLS